ncbi:hypothetical protein E2P84_38905 [Burkholderia cepacia]|uniref:Uncharacterized protein n=1 Tax=Burkholderia cepacia TaxID=292 RepID=A0AAX2RCN9_BURCE|nr:hypothetical protein E2P84_38905 [Burkholderia cepacia]TES96718.1 hypothetical protein E3D36_34705 [Burkholderia cepacia]TEU34406.1 hypothetical protein E3D37_38985 [Burkholderia cepacia]TEU38516.1 hypothetical protein E3D38_37555 [Burkholderia cepacia]TEU87153.1 hypothetical protein E3D40_39335 [Burkholderia cepacia]
MTGALTIVPWTAEAFLARYKDRVVLVLGVTAGDRRRIQWLTEDGKPRVSAVKQKHLRAMPPQLF